MKDEGQPFSCVKGSVEANEALYALIRDQVFQIPLESSKNLRLARDSYCGVIRRSWRFFLAHSQVLHAYLLTFQRPNSGLELRGFPSTARARQRSHDSH